MRITTWLSVLCVMTAISQSVRADDSSATVTVTVTINSAPCVINNNQNIDVDFGSNMAVTDVAAGMIERPITYALDCSTMDTEKSLKMMIQGTGTDFNGDVLKTSMTDLGIKIKANGSDYPLNTAFNFASADSKPTLTALLVQKPGARLQTGAFTAGATMTVDYQ